MKGRRTLRFATGLLALALAAGGCAQARQAPAAEAPASAFAYSDARKDEIKDLWIQIRGWRVEMGLTGAEPNRALKTRMTSATPVSSRCS